MKVAGGQTESGIVVGNTYDKYGSKNPIVKRLMRGFENALEDLVGRAAGAGGAGGRPSIHEVGCGEGYWTLKWLARGMRARGSDFSEKVIEMARANALEKGLALDIFRVRSVYDLNPAEDGAELVVCCEVLEHLEEPEKALEALCRVAGQHVILSVPREPVWSVLNMARGKYWGEWGNTPGHVQRWSRRRFLRMVSRWVEIERVHTPLPWTMLLGRPRNVEKP